VTDLKSAILAYITNRIAHQRNPKGQKKITREQELLLAEEGITILRSSRDWIVYKHGREIARTERRWLITKTNPKPRELKPKFKESF